MGNLPSTVTPTERRQLITDVSKLAAQLRPEQRDGFVERQCGGDKQLLQEVKSALSECRQPDEADGEGPPSPPPFKRIGKYEITGSIGSGGSGHVYSALDATVGRVVAIKVLNAPGDSNLVKRFRTEAKTVANLHHKNIVTVHEYGEEDGIPYLVMEYLNGTTLLDLIAQRSLSLLEKLEIMSEVAEGLHYAHEQGITHRDVKPANIMRLTDGSVKIMDFGIARLTAQNAARPTQSGLLVGSIMYMAPEQFNGTVDALTDVFSYGVTFYELLTGKNPFAAPEPAVIIFRIANTDPPPVRSLAPECPAALARILSRTLARDRQARYSSLSDVLADTRGILLDLRRDEALRLYTEAKRFFAAGQLDAAKGDVRKALELDPAQEDARKLRSEIEETLRQRDAGVRAESLIDQAEKAVEDQQYEEAGGILDAIRDLGVTNPKLQGRLDWAAAQVERARHRETLLTVAQRDLQNQNLTAAFHAVSEVLASDPGNSSGKDLLQEIRNQMAPGETRRRLQEEAARAEDLLRNGETDQAIFRLAEMERRHPEFAEAGILLARAEAQKAREERARRLTEGTAEVNELLKNGLFDMALARIDQIAIDFPDGDSPENQALQALRTQALEGPAAESRLEQIAKVISEAETSIARHEFDKAIHLLETAIAELGDDFDLTRLLLQAAVAANAAWEQTETERGRSAQAEGAPEDDQGPTAVNQWRETIGKLDRAFGPAPEPPFATERDLPFVTERELPPASRASEQRERAIGEILTKVQSLEVGARYAEAARLLDEGLREQGPDARLLGAQQRLSESLVQQQRAEAVDQACKEARSLRKRGRLEEAVRVLDSCESLHPGVPAIADLLAQIQKDREAPPRPWWKRARIWIMVCAITASVVILLLVVRPHFSFFTPENRPAPSGGNKLSIDEPAGSRTVPRGKDFSLELGASGGSLPLSWEIREGSLPPGLSLDRATGRIAGASVASCIYIFLVRTTDSAGHNAERAITVEVVEPPDVTKAPERENPGTKAPGAPPLEGNGGPGEGTKGGSKVPAGGAVAIPTNPNSGAAGTVPGRPKSGSKVPASGAVAIPANPNAGAASTAPMWPMDGGDLRRTGYAPYRGPRKPRIAWSVETGTTEPNSPLVGPDGRVYVRNGREHVLRCVENGRIVWSVRLPLDDQVGFGPDGSVQLSSIPGRTQTLNGDGISIRQVPSDIRWLGLYVWRGHSYKSIGIAPAGSTSTRWVFFRSDDQSWRVEVDGLASQPVIDENGVLYVGTAKGTIYAISDAATILWSFPTGAGATKGLAVTRARDILAAVGQSLFSVHEGRLKWKFQGDGDGIAFPPIHDQTGTIYFGKGSDFYAVSSSGQKLWQYKLGGPVSTAPAMDRFGRIYVATATQLYCISDADAPDPPQPVRAD